MKIRITVGEVEMRLEGLDLGYRHVRKLLMDAAGVAAALSTGDEVEPKPPFGFTAIVERRDEVIPSEDLDWYFDE